MKKIKGILALVGTGALALTLPTATVATPVSDVLVVFNAAGDLVGSATQIENGTERLNTLREVNTDLSNPALLGHYILMLDPDGTASDVVGIANAGTALAPHAVFGFVSSPLDANALLLAGFTHLDRVVIENGLASTTVDLTPYLNPVGGAAGGTASFTSDGDVPDAGTTMALLGMALAGLGVARRKLA